MRKLKSAEELPEIEYTRSDGDNFRYQCRIDGNRIVWRAYFNNSVQKGWGRWRDTDPNDSVLTYKITEDILILHNSSTGTSINIKKSEFKKP